MSISVLVWWGKDLYCAVSSSWKMCKTAKVSIPSFVLYLFPRHFFLKCRGLKCCLKVRRSGVWSSLCSPCEHRFCRGSPASSHSLKTYTRQIANSKLFIGVYVIVNSHCVWSCVTLATCPGCTCLRHVTAEIDSRNPSVTLRKWVKTMDGDYCTISVLSQPGARARNKKKWSEVRSKSNIIASLTQSCPTVLAAAAAGAAAWYLSAIHTGEWPSASPSRSASSLNVNVFWVPNVFLK